jgi:hypothetical protein
VLRVIGGIAHEEHEPVAHGLGLGEARPHQGAADPLPAPGGVDRERAQKEDGLAAQPDRPVADGAHEPPFLPGDEAQLTDRRHAGAVAVGFLVVPVGAEGEIEQSLDGRAVQRTFGGDHEQGGSPGMAGETVTRAFPTPFTIQSASTRMTRARRRQRTRRRRSTAKAADS